MLTVGIGGHCEYRNRDSISVSGKIKAGKPDCFVINRIGKGRFESGVFRFHGVSGNSGYLVLRKLDLC